MSGGQKQRLAIARAIAKDPHIYVFDDSFSALDMKTDARLRAALSEVTENASVIIVAQRISTIIHADQILVLDDGKIVGKGTHEELLKIAMYICRLHSHSFLQRSLDLMIRWQKLQQIKQQILQQKQQQILRLYQA